MKCFEKMDIDSRDSCARSPTIFVDGGFGPLWIGCERSLGLGFRPMPPLGQDTTKCGRWVDEMAEKGL